MPRPASTPEPNCIMCMQDDGYEIAGPFSSHADLIAYGKRWQAEHGDDPRWQSLYLADPAVAPKVVTPLNAAAQMDALVKVVRHTLGRAMGPETVRIFNEELLHHRLSGLAGFA